MDGDVGDRCARLISGHTTPASGPSTSTRPGLGATLTSTNFGVCRHGPMALSPRRINSTAAETLVKMPNSDPTGGSGAYGRAWQVPVTATIAPNVKAFHGLPKSAPIVEHSNLTGIAYAEIPDGQPAR